MRELRICANPGCGARLNTHNNGQYCASCEKKLAPTSQQQEIRLQAYAEYYGFASEGTLQRFKDHIKGKIGARVINVSYDEKSGYIFYSEPEEMRGPVADVPERFLLKPGTTTVQTVLSSGAVAGNVFQGVLTSGLQHPWVVEQAQTGHSGVVVTFRSP